MTDRDFKRRIYIETIEIDKMIVVLEELRRLQSLNYEPYAEKQTKIAIRALLNIRGFKSLKSFHIGDKQ